MAKRKDQEEASEGQKNAPVPPAQPGSGSPGRDSPGQSAPAPAQAKEAAAASEGPCASAEDRITILEKENADLQDKLLRKQADFENYRKRMLREREDSARYSNAALLSDLIGLIDDFERAIRSAEESPDFANFLQGITMIEKQFLEMLESRWGLKRFSAVGEGFDPARHEAVQRVEGPGDGKPKVVEEYQRGYYLHERVLRPARVKVMVPSSGNAPGDSGSPGQNRGPAEPGTGVPG